MCSREPGTRIGTCVPGTNICVCGKLKPFGSRHGPYTRYASSISATYTSIKLTRISLAWKRSRINAVSEAHAMPPSTPAISTATSIHFPVCGPANSAMPPPAIAPSSNWPSAPMFHTLARKHTASPSAMRISGVAFTPNSVNA